MTTPDTDAVRTALSARPSTAQGVADATGIPIRRVHTLLRRVGASEVGFAPRTGGRPAALWAFPCVATDADDQSEGGLTPEELDKLSNDPNAWTRLGAALNSQTAPFTLIKLSRDRDEQVRQCALDNPHYPRFVHAAGPDALPTPPAPAEPPARVGGDEVFVALAVFTVLGMWIYLFYSAL